MARERDDDTTRGASGQAGTVPPDIEQIVGRSGLELSPGPGLIGKLRAGYNLIVVALACIVMISITLLMGAEVFFRYVLGSSLIWAEETCRYLLVWTTFLFAGAAFQRGEMIAVEFFVNRINYRLGLLASIIGYLLVLALLIYLVRYGYEYAALNDIQMIPAADFIWSGLTGREANVPVFWIYVALPVGCTILAVHFLIATLDKVVRLFSTRPDVDGATEGFLHGDGPVGGA